jgi:hypothetical protein
MYESKNPLVKLRQDKTESLVLPFKLTANATPASKTYTNDEPGILFFNFQGLTGATVAAGAFDTAGELSAITWATATDTTGVFNVVVRVGDQITKVVSATCSRNAVATGEIIKATFPTGATTGISSAGDKIVLNFDSAVDFSAADYDGIIRVEYTVSK